MSARRIVAAVALVIVVCLAGTAAYLYTQERETRRQILEAAGAVSTVVDYSDSDEYLTADLAARQKLDTLAARNLSGADLQTAECIQNYLASVESLNSSHTIETTELREGIAMAAAKKMDTCMADFRSR